MGNDKRPVPYVTAAMSPNSTVRPARPTLGAVRYAAQAAKQAIESAFAVIHAVPLIPNIQLWTACGVKVKHEITGNAMTDNAGEVVNRAGRALISRMAWTEAIKNVHRER